MVTINEILLIPSQPQSFSVTLGGVQYKFGVQWRDAMAQCWIMDIEDTNGNLLLCGAPLLPGADLLEQYPDLNFPGQLWIGVESDPNASPGFNDLGVSSHLYFVVP